MGRDILLSDLGLRHALLVRAHSGDDAQSAGVDLPSAITNNTDYDFLPAFLAPGLAPVPFTKMGDVFDDTVHSAAKEILFLVVHGHDDEEFCTTRGVVVDLSESEARVFEIVGIAGGG